MSGRLLFCAPFGSRPDIREWWFFWTDCINILQLIRDMALREGAGLVNVYTRDGPVTCDEDLFMLPEGTLLYLVAGEINVTLE